jgi:hypothetical protein
MLFFRPKPRRFVYYPRFYREEEDPERRIRFRRRTLYDPHQRRLSFMMLFLLFILVLLLIGYLLPRLSTVNPAKSKVTTDDVLFDPDFN